MMKDFGYKNRHAGAAIEKIVLNIGAGEGGRTEEDPAGRRTI